MKDFVRIVGGFLILGFLANLLRPYIAIIGLVFMSLTVLIAVAAVIWFAISFR